MPSIRGFAEYLTDEQKEGWGTGAFYKTLDDRHFLLLCKKCAPPAARIPATLDFPLPAAPQRSGAEEEPSL